MLRHELLRSRWTPHHPISEQSHPQLSFPHPILGTKYPKREVVILNEVKDLLLARFGCPILDAHLRQGWDNQSHVLHNPKFPTAPPGKLILMNSTLFPEPAPQTSTGLLIAHCDGGSRGNPGPAGYGAVIEDQNGRILARLSEYLGKRTNNYAEYSALLGVLAWTLEHKHTRLRVVADSELMVKQMQGKYKVNSPDLRPLWEEARRRASQLEKFEIAHTLRGGNKLADQLANEAMDRGMGRTSTPQPASSSTQPAASNSSTRPTPAKAPQPKQVLEGFVKNGVVHLIEGELPEGIFVKIIRE
jgi:ribonuclease HI